MGFFNNFFNFGSKNNRRYNNDQCDDGQYSNSSGHGNNNGGGHGNNGGGKHGNKHGNKHGSSNHGNNSSNNYGNANRSQPAMMANENFSAYCSQCGGGYTANSKFCNQCGNSLSPSK